MLTKRLFLHAALALSAVLAGCASTAPALDPQVRNALAPTGTLRVGVYPGSPTSLVRDAKGERAGVALDLGNALGKQLGVPVQVVEFARLALVLDALKAGKIDFTFTNATPVRAKDVDFTPALVQLELGYLVPAGSAIWKPEDVDKSGVRVGVSQGSSSQGVLSQTYKSATLVPAASINQAQEMLLSRKVDAFATNKAILFEMLDGLPNHRILGGRWGLENLAIAVPQGRSVAMPYLQQFAQQVRSNGVLQAAVNRAGLRGTAQAQ
ncbi:MAG: transporter substrate-binding domain-containing protein [Burkholderiaceae bacterium]